MVNITLTTDSSVKISNKFIPLNRLRGRNATKIINRLCRFSRRVELDDLQSKRRVEDTKLLYFVLLFIVFYSMLTA